MKAEPQKEHRWLQRLLGEWVMEAEAAGPGQPPTTSKWTETVRSLGGVWVVCEGRGEMPDGGGPATTLMTLGFDPRTGRYVGTWVGSMITHLWVYDGSVDASGNVLTLDTEGPDFAGGGKSLAKYKDVIEFKGDDRRVLTAHVLGPDGNWRQFMTSQYRRKK